MAYETLQLFIDGKWTDGTSGITEDVINPATEEVLGQLPHASQADLDDALAAADKGFKVWRATSPLARQAILNKAADLMEERKASIAHNIALDMGKPAGEASLEMDFVIGCLRWDAEQGKRAYGRLIPARMAGQRQMMVKEPVGPVAAFVAWNFPASNVMRKLGNGLAAGCSIIMKASEETPSAAIAMTRAFQDAGLPDGVLNRVWGKPALHTRRHVAASPSRQTHDPLHNGTWRPRPRHGVQRRRYRSSGKNVRSHKIPQRGSGLYLPNPLLCGRRRL